LWAFIAVVLLAVFLAVDGCVAAYPEAAPKHKTAQNNATSRSARRQLRGATSADTRPEDKKDLDDENGVNIVSRKP
jgi:hypothetical protein